MRLSFRALTFGLALAAGSLVGAAAQSATSGVSEQAKADLTGAYKLVDASKKKAEIRRRVDEATEEMTLLKGLARDRLYETTEPLPLVAIKFPGDRVSVVYLGEKAVVTPADGTPTKWTGRFGDRTQVRQSFEGGKLVQRFKGQGGGLRKNVYTLSADGKRLTVSTTITADLLPAAIQFKTVYARK